MEEKKGNRLKKNLQFLKYRKKEFVKKVQNNKMQMFQTGLEVFESVHG